MSGLKAGGWVLVADGQKALFLRNDGDGTDIDLNVLRKDEQENPQAQDWAANRPGRFNDGPSAHKSAVQDTDWHELEKDRFAQDLAEILYKRAHSGAFEALVVIAAPETLGRLREDLHQEVRERIVAEIPKDFTGLPVDELERRVARALAE